MKKIFLAAVLATSTLLSAQTKIIAHRGFWKTAVPTAQNSIQSLKNAQQLMVYGSEFDVRMTKDGHLVICHDEKHGDMEISETKFSNLKKVRLSNGERLPTFKSYLKQGKKQPLVKMIVEIKPAKSEILENRLVTSVMDEVRRSHSENQCEFISFSKNICLQAKKQNPSAIVQYLMSDIKPTEITALGLNGIDYYYKIFTEKYPGWLQEAKDEKLITNAWTIDDVETFNQLKNRNIDYVTTDIPDILQKL